MSTKVSDDAAPSSAASSRRSSFSRSGHRRGLSGITPRELKYIDNVIPLDRRQKWKKYSVEPIKSTDEFESQFVRNVETTLGRSLLNCDTLAAYQATARSLRDTLIVRWNRTQQKQTLDDPKRVYYLSLEYLMGRALDNATLNLGLQPDVKEGLHDFGFKFEDVIDKEPDAGLGNGGLGRLAACFVDSLCTLDYPAWAYGIRYKYGIFRQKIIDGAQVEFPDTWLDFGNPWEIPRPELSFDVMFYGRVEQTEEGDKKWVGGDLVEAKAYDFLVPGFHTKNVNTLRLWQAEPSSQFDFAKFNEGDYTDAIGEQTEASTISAVLYPNDNFYQGKELRLKQQYFWVAASLADILRRFKKTRKPWSRFADSCSIQLNDTHPTLAVVELLRLLVDVEGLDWHEAWAITTSTFAYTNHTVMPEALEKWGVDIFGNLLPRHLEIIYNVNYFFLKDVSAKFPGDEGLLSRVSLIEESSPKQVRMAYLAVIASKKVNGVAELHSDLIKQTIFSDFVKIFGESHFTNVTNGITPRRWLLESNPRLASLIASKLGGYGFIKDLDQLQNLKKFVKDASFRKEWIAIKEANKSRLIDLIKSQNPTVDIDPTALFDIQVKRIHEYKRQQLNLFGIIYRYLYLKSLTPEQRRHIAPRVSIFGGKSAPGYYAAKLIIKLINAVGKRIAEDPEVSDYLKVIYVEEYNVSKAQILVSASDISEHISTAGTEASGTSNMKFVLNGGLIIGTVDGANIEIGREIGEENIYYFGHLSEAVEEVRSENRAGVELSEKLKKVFETIDSGVFGEPSEFASLLDSTRKYGDYYLVNADFDAYIETQSKIDDDFKNKEVWVTKSINSVASMGFFSSDRAIREYAEGIWEVEPAPVEGADPLSPSAASSKKFSDTPVSAATGTSAARNEALGSIGSTAPITGGSYDANDLDDDYADAADNDADQSATSYTEKGKQAASSVAATAAATAGAAGAAVAGAAAYLTGKSKDNEPSEPRYSEPHFVSAPIGGDIPVSTRNDYDYIPDASKGASKPKSLDSKKSPISSNLTSGYAENTDLPSSSSYSKGVGTTYGGESSRDVSTHKAGFDDSYGTAAVTGDTHGPSGLHSGIHDSSSLSTGDDGFYPATAASDAPLSSSYDDELSSSTYPKGAGEYTSSAYDDKHGYSSKGLGASTSSGFDDQYGSSTLSKTVDDPLSSTKYDDQLGSSSKGLGASTSSGYGDQLGSSSHGLGASTSTGYDDQLGSSSKGFGASSSTGYDDQLGSSSHGFGASSSTGYDDQLGSSSHGFGAPTSTGYDDQLGSSSKGLGASTSTGYDDQLGSSSHGFGASSSTGYDGQLGSSSHGFGASSSTGYDDQLGSSGLSQGAVAPGSSNYGDQLGSSEYSGVGKSHSESQVPTSSGHIGSGVAAGGLAGAAGLAGSVAYAKNAKSEGVPTRDIPVTSSTDLADQLDAAGGSSYPAESANTQYADSGRADHSGASAYGANKSSSSAHGHSYSRSAERNFASESARRISQSEKTVYTIGGNKPRQTPSSASGKGEKTVYTIGGNSAPIRTSHEPVARSSPRGERTIYIGSNAAPIGTSGPTSPASASSGKSDRTSYIAGANKGTSSTSRNAAAIAAAQAVGKSSTSGVTRTPTASYGPTSSKRYSQVGAQGSPISKSAATAHSTSGQAPTAYDSYGQHPADTSYGQTSLDDGKYASYSNKVAGETYDPVGVEDESQVTGAYGSYANKPVDPVYADAHETYDPTRIQDEGQVTGAYGSHAGKPTTTHAPLSSDTSRSYANKSTTETYDPTGYQDEGQAAGAYGSYADKSTEPVYTDASETYDPTGAQDEGQVSGAYGSYADKPATSHTPLTTDTSRSYANKSTGETYDPTGYQDEGQVTGAYGSYADKPTTTHTPSKTSDAYGSHTYKSATETYDPTGAQDEGQVSGAYGSIANKPKAGVLESEPASYGSADITGASYGSVEGAVPHAYQGSVDSTSASDSYSRGGGASAVGGSALLGAGAAALGLSSTRDSATANDKGTRTAGLDKDYTAQPSSGANVSDNSRASGIFSEISSASSIETDSVESGHAPRSELHRNLADPTALSSSTITRPVDTSRDGGIAGNAEEALDSFNEPTPTADASFSGPSSQDVPLNNKSATTKPLSSGSGSGSEPSTTATQNADGSWTEKATGVAAGVGAAVAGGAAALFATKGDGKEEPIGGATKIDSTKAVDGKNDASLTEKATGVVAGAGATATGAINNALGYITGNTPKDGKTDTDVYKSTSSGKHDFNKSQPDSTIGVEGSQYGSSSLPDSSRYGSEPHAADSSYASTKGEFKDPQYGSSSLPDSSRYGSEPYAADSSYSSNKGVAPLAGTSGSSHARRPSTDAYGSAASSNYDSAYRDATDFTPSYGATSTLDPKASTLDPKSSELDPNASASYKTLDPAAANEKYQTEVSSPSNGPVVTDGVQSAHTATKSQGPGTNAGFVGAGSGVAGASGAGIASQQLKQADPETDASVRSLDSRTAPVPESGATVTGLGGQSERFNKANETSDRRYAGVGDVNDPRRNSLGSYGTSTGETEFEDAEDYGSPNARGHKNAPLAGAAAGVPGADRRASVSSQSTIGKGNVKNAQHPTLDPNADTSADHTQVANASEPGFADAPDTTPVANGPVAGHSAGTATTEATKDTRPSTAATGDHHQDAAHKSEGGAKTSGAADLIPTDALHQRAEKTGGDNSALKGPTIDKEKVEEYHEKIIAAAKKDGETRGITTSGGAADNVKQAASEAPGKHAHKEGEETAEGAPDKKKGCRCC